MKRTSKRIINVTGTSASQTSDTFIASKDKRFSLVARVNGGSGTQTLEGTFALNCRNDSNSAFVAVSSYSFTSSPAGSAWNYNERFDGASDAEYQVVFTRTAGTGDITVDVNNE